MALAASRTSRSSQRAWPWRVALNPQTGARALGLNSCHCPNRNTQCGESVGFFPFLLFNNSAAAVSAAAVKCYLITFFFFFSSSSFDSAFFQVNPSWPYKASEINFRSSHTKAAMLLQRIPTGFRVFVKGQVLS